MNRPITGVLDQGVTNVEAPATPAPTAWKSRVRHFLGAMLAGFIAMVSPLAPAADPPAAPAKSDAVALRETTLKLIQAVTNSDRGFQRLAYLCDTFGPRFSGSTNLEAAIDWVLAEAKKDGLENVRGEEVMVPHWVRGEESLALVSPRPQSMRMTGLGGSIATPADGIEAQVLVVKSFADLKARADEAKGKIVLFNVPFTTYGGTVQYRYDGAFEAAKAGAVASLVRSVTPFSLQTPHTGAMRYQDGVPRIPHAAVTLEDAEMLQRMQDRGQRVVVRLKMDAATLPDAKSRDVIAEIPGREKPEEIVVISGHIDSWDNSPGALDDAGGVMAAWEAIRVMRELGLHPRRTVRLILWANEENGLGGILGYRTNHLADLGRHVLAIESDLGVMKPEGFVCAMGDAALQQTVEMAKALDVIGAGTIKRGGAFGDLSPLLEKGVPCMELQTQNDIYFRYHHTGADTPDKVNPAELQLCAAAIAVMAYSAAERPEPLPR